MASMLSASSAGAQGLVLDPSFRPGAVYQPADVKQSIAQPDGKILLVTTATRVGGQSANGKLSRLLANSDQVDTVFAANVAGLQGDVLQAAVRPDNHIILITGRGSLALGGVSRLGVLGLNPDGTVDAGFNAATTVPQYLSCLAVQPDGKVLIGGFFGQWALGQNAPGLVRLTATGSLDAGFTAALGQGFRNPIVDFVSLQADGAIIVGGRFDEVNGVQQPRLARLLPNGAFDANFRPVLPPAATVSIVWYAFGALTQPDGKIVIASFLSQPNPAWPPLVRLLPTGALDPTFQTGTNFDRYFPYDQLGNPLCLLANGKLLVGTTASTYDGSPVSRLVRLTAAGRLDPTFANTLAAGPGTWGSNTAAPVLALLPGGQVLAAGVPTRYAGDLIPTPLARLDSASGGRLAGFVPLVHRSGEVRDVLRQPDGRYLVAGAFTEINGSASPYLARLSAGGAVEPAFTVAAQPDNPVHSLAVQADGKVVVGGAFQLLAGGVAPGVGRLLPTGDPDPAFTPTFPAGTVPYPVVAQVALEPGGDILLRGALVPGSLQPLVRLRGLTGQRDPAFAPNYYNAETLLVQPDGGILLAGYRVGVGSQGPVSLVRLLPAGNADPGFAPYPPDNRLRALALDPATGQIYASGSLSAATLVLRFGPTGTRDASYAPVVPGAGIVDVRSLALQPSGRLLLGGLFGGTASVPGFGLARLLPAGTEDASFARAAGPGFIVNQVLAQTDGAVVVAGNFTTVGGTPAVGLARLLDPNVLAVGRAAGGGPVLAAWPVPAHGLLHVRRAATTGPARVALLDGLGREVRAQVATGPETSLSVVGLAAGMYLLRVRDATGSSTRRVVVSAE